MKFNLFLDWLHDCWCVSPVEQEGCLRVRFRSRHVELEGVKAESLAHFDEEGKLNGGVFVVEAAAVAAGEDGVLRFVPFTDEDSQP